MWPISVQCRVLEVSVAGYHEHFVRRASGAQRRHLSDDALHVHIKAIQAETHGGNGWPRTWKEWLAKGKPMSRLWPIARAPLLSVALALFTTSAIAQNGGSPTEAQVHDYIKRAALVGFEWAFQPLNSILLLRGNHAFCAIRFVSFGRSNDSRSPTPFDTGEDSEFAVYEVSEITIRDAEVVLGPVVRKELDYRGMRGLGRLAFHVGDTDLHCGKDKYSWVYPTGVRLKPTQEAASLAPTNWISFAEIRLDAPKLQWYKRDSQMQRPFIVLLLKDLPP